MLLQLIVLLIILSLTISGCVIAKNNHLGIWANDDKPEEPNFGNNEIGVTDPIEQTEEIEETVETTEPLVFIDVELPDGYDPVTEDVRILSHVKLRSRPSDNQNDVVEIVPMYSIATRVGIGQNGWSVIITENGTLGYLASYYLEPTADPTYTKVYEVVYATKDANARSGPSILYDVVENVEQDNAFIRTAIGDNGWSKIIYEEEEVYVYSLYLTTDEPGGGLVDNATYEEVNETAYTTTRVNVRVGPGPSYIVVGRLKNGESVTRVGIGDNGWSKILYEGDVYYVISKYLKTK
jgi:uncharacterized protein YraI